MTDTNQPSPPKAPGGWSTLGPSIAYVGVTLVGALAMVLSGIFGGEHAGAMMTQTAMLIGAVLASLASLFKTQEGNQVITDVQKSVNGERERMQAELGRLRDENTLLKAQLNAKPAPPK